MDRKETRHRVTAFKKLAAHKGIKGIEEGNFVAWLWGALSKSIGHPRDCRGIKAFRVVCYVAGF